MKNFFYVSAITALLVSGCGGLNVSNYPPGDKLSPPRAGRGVFV
jgi:hypothetical protein